MPENKEIPNQNTLFSSNSQSHSPPKPAEPPKGPDAKAPPAADAKKPAEPAKAPDAKAPPAADAKKPTEPPKAPDAKAAPAADSKKPTEPAKAPDTKAAPAADAKKPAELRHGDHDRYLLHLRWHRADRHGRYGRRGDAGRDPAKRNRGRHRERGLFAVHPPSGWCPSSAPSSSPFCPLC